MDAAPASNAALVDFPGARPTALTLWAFGSDLHEVLYRSKGLPLTRYRAPEPTSMTSRALDSANDGVMSSQWPPRQRHRTVSGPIPHERVEVAARTFSLRNVLRQHRTHHLEEGLERQEQMREMYFQAQLRQENERVRCEGVEPPAVCCEGLEPPDVLPYAL